jgi:hypothetical protein
MPNFCTVAGIENFLQVTIHTDPVKNASALRAITEATEAIKNYCHQVIERVASDVITLDCNGGSRLFLPELPVKPAGIISVVEDGETLTVDDDYKLGQHGILYRIGDVWHEGIQIIRVTYTHGYAKLPADIVGVCVRAASRAYQAGLRAAELDGVLGVTALTLGDYSVSFGAESGGGVSEGILGASAARMLLLSEKDILNRYRYVGQ